MRIVWMIIYVLIALVTVGFAALNAGNSTINLYFSSYSMPTALLIMLCCFLGTVIGFFLFLGRYWRLKGEVFKMKSQLKLTEKEIKNLRAIPLQD